MDLEAPVVVGWTFEVEDTGCWSHCCQDVQGVFGVSCSGPQGMLGSEAEVTGVHRIVDSGLTGRTGMVVMV